MFESITNRLSGSKSYDPTPYREMIKYVLQKHAAYPEPLDYAFYYSTIEVLYRNAIEQKEIPPEEAATVIRAYTDSVAMVKFIDRSIYKELDNAIEEANAYKSSVFSHKYLEAIREVIGRANSILNAVPYTYRLLTHIESYLEGIIREWNEKREALLNEKYPTQKTSPGFLKGCRLLKLEHDTLIVKLNPDCEKVGDSFGDCHYRLPAGDYILKEND